MTRPSRFSPEVRDRAVRILQALTGAEGSENGGEANPNTAEASG